MLKEPVHLSDWIQFLLTIRNIGFTIIGVILTIIVGLIGFTLIKPISYVFFIETYILIFFLFYLEMWFVTSKKSPLEKSRKLLKDIMGNPNEIEVDKIREEWFKKRETMKTNIKLALKHARPLLWFIALLVVLAAVGLLLFIPHSVVQFIYAMSLQIIGVFLLSAWSLLERVQFTIKWIGNLLKNVDGNPWRDFDKFCRTTGLGLVIAGLIVELVYGLG